MVFELKGNFMLFIMNILVLLKKVMVNGRSNLKINNKIVIIIVFVIMKFFRVIFL